MNIIGTGLSGLVGSRIVELLGNKHVFTNLSLETGVDITNHEMVYEKLSQSDAPWILHLAAFTDVQGAEKDRSLGNESVAWKVNVEATQHIIDAAHDLDKHVLCVDTDYAFDGKKKIYTEVDVPSPLGWYATTKSEAAKRTLAAGGLVIRISNPYRANPVGKKDFVHKMLERLEQHMEITAPTDQLFVPTFIDDIAVAIDTLISVNASGLYHVVGNPALSPFVAAKSVAQIFDCDETLVRPTTFVQYFQGRTPIPQYVELSNDKIRNLGLTMRSFEEGLREVKRQEDLSK